MIPAMRTAWHACRFRAVALASLLSLATGSGCGAEEDPPAGAVVSEIAPVSPTGSVSGYVYDALSGAPVEGATVIARVPAADAAKQASTDADGGFLLEGVPASNQVALHIRHEDHFDALDTVAVPSSAGNLAQDNGVGFSGPIGLLPTPTPDAHVLDVVVRAAGAAALASVTARLEVGWVDADEPEGNLFATVSDEGEGRFSLGGLPDFARLAAVVPSAVLRLVVVPEDAVYSPRVVELTVSDALAQGAVLVELAAPVDGGEQDLLVLDSNVRDLVEETSRFPSVLTADTPVTIAFNADVDEESFFATAVNDRGQTLSTLATVVGENVSLAITGVTDGDEVYIYLEALPAGAASSAGPVSLLQASGFFVTPSSQGLGVAAYVADRKNHALRATGDSSQLRCPADSGAYLWLELTEHVGARAEDGTPVATASLLPIRVTSTTAPADHPLNPANGGLTGRVVEQPSGPPASGFSRWVRVGWAPLPTDQPAGDTTTYQLKLVFNDASLGATGQDAVVRFPTGAPVESVQQAGVQVAVTETGCVSVP